MFYQGINPVETVMISMGHSDKVSQGLVSASTALQHMPPKSNAPVHLTGLRMGYNFYSKEQV